MHETNLAAVDLNLLVVFEALLHGRSVVRAGNRLSLSQPAVSHALSRLRLLLGDPLFVRCQGGMAPTPRALELEPILAESLARIRALLSAREFAPGESRRTFAIGMPDYAAYILLPRLLSDLAETAPGVKVVVRNASRATIVDLMIQGQIDLAVGNLPDVKPPIARQPLFSDGFVCALRRDHPALSRPWTLENWLELDHLNVSLAGEAAGYVDQFLARRGAERRITASIGQFLLASHLAASTDLVATEPRNVLMPMAEAAGLALRPVPFDVPDFTTFVAWHVRVKDDPGYLWLKDKLVSLARDQVPVRLPGA